MTYGDGGPVQLIVVTVSQSDGAVVGDDLPEDD